MYFRFIFSRPVHHRRSSISCLSSPHQMSFTSCPSISTQRASLETTTEEPHLCGHAPAVSGTGSLDVFYIYLRSVFFYILIHIPANTKYIESSMQKMVHALLCYLLWYMVLLCAEKMYASMQTETHPLSFSQY